MINAVGTSATAIRGILRKCFSNLFKKSTAGCVGGGRTSPPFSVTVCVDVSIRAPVRGRTFTALGTIPDELVSIRAPVEGANLGIDHVLHGFDGVSIRAPVRGRTRLGGCRPGAGRVSIRAPVRGRTGDGRQPSCAWNSFNPRPREGANKEGSLASVSATVSIRAPVRGRTRAARVKSLFNAVSIRAPVRGRTGTTAITATNLKVFQSAPP